MSISIYDPTWWNNIPGAAQRGGQSRSKTAKRLQGKFLPNDEFLASMVQPDPNHGRKGGLKILEKYGKEHFSKIAKMRRKS